MYDLKGKTLGRYRLLTPVARGGMGQVWLGRLQGARGFSKMVAVKTLLPSRDNAERLEGMLTEEARIASLIQHPNVVQTIELGEHEGVLYLVMEWVDGESLGYFRERAAELGGMPWTIAVQLVGQVLAGLHAAHELRDEAGLLGVVHRDVSPSNVLVTYDGVAKVLDFGIAKATQQALSTTQQGEVKGKFSYMSPEQLLGDSVDRRCDVFACGILLYLLTTGQHPFTGQTAAAVVRTIVSDEPIVPPSKLREGYPPELERVVLQALARRREERWPSAESMRAALERALPAGFGEAARAEVTSFVNRVAAERQLARRAAVRSAQLEADLGEPPSLPHVATPNGSASVSSLRAISLSKPAPEEPLGAVSQSNAAEPAVASPSRVGKGVGLLIAACLLLLTFAAWPSRDRSLAAGHPVAAALPASGAPLSAQPAPRPSWIPSPSPPAAASTSVGQDLSGSPALAAPGGASPRVASSRPKAPPRKPSTKLGAPSNDLLIPDYAH
ncbi:MAG: serine/threonine protein kinase [Myxococcales bacterium]|nr:MAG: serine/threonine protein kinase [Myxococcales bacterium]